MAFLRSARPAGGCGVFADSGNNLKKITCPEISELEQNRRIVGIDLLRVTQPRRLSARLLQPLF